MMYHNDYKVGFLMKARRRTYGVHVRWKSGTITSRYMSNKQDAEQMAAHMRRLSGVVGAWVSWP